MNVPSTATPPGILKILEGIGPDMPPEVFKQVYETALGGSPDREVLTRLMHVAGLYLDRRPGVLLLPRAMAEELLASQDYDELLAGLKAIRHSTASTGEVIAHCLAVMKRETWEERYAGLYQLAQVVGGSSASVRAATDQSILNHARAVLAHIASHAPHDHARYLAAQSSAAITQSGKA